MLVSGNYIEVKLARYVFCASLSASTLTGCITYLLVTIKKQVFSDIILHFRFNSQLANIFWEIYFEMIEARAF